MSIKQYWLTFGTDDPRTYSGLAPTFIQFFSHLGQTLAPPGISEVFAGSGAYNFQYNTSSSLSIFFLCDGVTSSLGTSLRYIQGSLDPIQSVDITARDVGTTMQAIGASNFALGTTAVAIGTTLLGYGATNVALGIANFITGTTLLGFGTTNAAVGTSLTAIGASIYQQTLLNVLSLGSTASAIGSTSVDPGDVYGYLKRIQEVLEGNQTFNKATGSWLISSRGSTLLASKSVTDSQAAVTRS